MYSNTINNQYYVEHGSFFQNEMERSLQGKKVLLEIMICLNELQWEIIPMGIVAMEFVSLEIVPMGISSTGN